MRYKSLLVVLTTLAFSTTLVNAEVPVNARCALLAQKKARNGGPDYRQIYNRTFELCVVKAMPRERQTDYYIEKLKRYVALSRVCQPIQRPRRTCCSNRKNQNRPALG